MLSPSIWVHHKWLFTVNLEKTMANHWNIKSIIVLNKDPLVKEAKVVKVSAIPKSTGADTTRPICLEAYADNEIKGVNYSVLTCPTVFVQTFQEMCLDTDIVCLYKHFILRGSNLLSMYWREAYTKTSDKKTGKVWDKGTFASIMKEYMNWVLSINHDVVTRGIFHSYLQQALKKPNNMTQRLSRHTSRFSSSCMTTSRLIMN